MANYFYDPNSTYGSDQNWYDTPFVKTEVDPINQGGVFTAWLGQQGLGGFDRQSMFGKSLQSRYNSGYEGAQLNNPGLTFRDYLSGQGSGQINDIWAGLTPGQRGENPSMFAPKARWIGRG